MKRELTPDPASATTPRSRGLTKYIVLTVDASGYKTELDTKPEARTPEAAITLVAKDLPDDCEIVVAVPVSSYHVFVRTRTFTRVDS